MSRARSSPVGVAHLQYREDERARLTAPQPARTAINVCSKASARRRSLLQRVQLEVFTHDFIFILKRCMVLNKVEAPICHTVQDTSVAATFPIGELLASRRSVNSVSPGPTYPVVRLPEKSKIFASPVFTGYAKPRRCSRLIRSSLRLGECLSRRSSRQVWRWVPGDETDEHAKELARYANECWGTDGYPGMMSVSWEDQLQYLWEFAPIGYRYAEEVYRVDNDENGVAARMA